MKYFSFLSLMVGVAILYFGAPYLKPNTMLYVYPKGAFAVYYIVVFIGLGSVAFGFYSILGIFGWVRKKYRKRKNRSWYYEGNQMFLKNPRI